MKKYIFTESQIKKIINNQIKEQAGTIGFDEKEAINSGSVDFLRAKGIQGKDLTQKIMIYQKSIKCEPTGHMMDCIDKMPPKDFDLWKSYIQKNKPIYDKIGDWLKKGFGVKKDPKQLY